MCNKYSQCQSYKVMEHETMGYAYFMWNKEAQMWQQVTKWYYKYGNLKRQVLKHFGHHLL